MALSALRGAPQGCTCPARSRRQQGPRLRPARPGRAVLAMASPKPQPGKPSAGEVLDNFFQVCWAPATACVLQQLALLRVRHARLQLPRLPLLSL